MSAAGHGSSTRRCATASSRPGASMTVDEKLDMAAAARVGSASTSSRPAFRRLPATSKRSAASPRRSRARVVAVSPARNENDIERRLRRCRGPSQPRIHTFIATVGHPPQAQAADDPRRANSCASRKMVAYARRRSSRTSSSRPRMRPAPSWDFLREVLAAAIDAGATTSTCRIPSATPPRRSTPAHGVARPRARHRRCRHLGSLPQRPGNGARRTTLAAIAAGARPGEVHGQRHRRARRQHRARGGRDGALATRRRPVCRRRYANIRPSGSCPTSRLVSGITGSAGPAQQGHRGRAMPSRTRPASTRTAC